jgi:toxin HigB-1
MRASTLQVAFASPWLRTICESERFAKEELGEAVTEVLKHRLADMAAATSVVDLVAGRPRVLAGTALDQMAVELYESFVITFSANHTNSPKTETGDLDWKRVSRIKILRIGCDRG